MKTHAQKQGGGGSSSKSALLVAKEGGKIVGCVGLETRVIRQGQVTKQESLRGEVRASVILSCVLPTVLAWLIIEPPFQPPNEQVPGASVQPVIANLAVDRSIRRRGIGRRILRECERVVKGACGGPRPSILLLRCRLASTRRT